MTRVLFVDDEAPVLASLRGRLRRRRTLDACFACGGAAALDALSHDGPFDAVVSDLRMPDVDGDVVLREAQRLHPGAVRLILSGYVAPEFKLKTIPFAHRFLDKPIALDELEQVLIRAVAVRQRLADPALQARVTSWTKLPSLSPTVHRLDRAMAAPDSDLKTIEQILEDDPGVSVAVLRAVNAACHGIPRTIQDIHGAVLLLGLELVRVVVLSQELFSQTPTTALLLDPGALQRHSMEVGAAASALAPPSLRGEAFAAGLLHELGTLMLAIHEPDSLGDPVLHASLGAALLDLWGMPLTVVEAVAGHHEASAAPSLGHYLHAAHEEHPSPGAAWDAP